MCVPPFPSVFGKEFVYFAVFTLPLAGFIPWCQILMERVETGRKKTSGQKEF